jgi:WS/DGAT/MGAT family acyltransferase
MGSEGAHERSRPMSVSDAFFLYFERPEAALNLGGVTLVDGTVRLRDLVARLDAQVASSPRYAQRPSTSWLGASLPYWEPSPGYDTAHHVQHWALPESAGEHELFALAAHLISVPLAPRRPLWRVHLIELPDGRSALVHSLHHCMVDGLGGMFLLEQLFDPLPPRRSGAVRPAAARGGAVRDPDPSAPRVFGRRARARAARELLLSSSFEAVRLGLRDIPRLPWNAPLGRTRALAPLRLPQAALRRARRASGATANDVLLSVIAGGLHRYLEAGGTSTRGLELTALVPVSLRARTGANALGNRISAMLVPLPTDLEREPPRLAVMARIGAQLRAHEAWTGIGDLLELLERAPSWLLRAGARALPLERIANLVVTNVPGPRQPRTLFGAPVTEIHPVVPIAHGMGLGVAALSYADRLQVTLHADAELVPDLDKLRLGMEEAFSALTAA